VAGRYAFRTTFELAADPAEVFTAVLAPEGWLTGLRHVRHLEQLRARREDQGPAYRTTVAAVLPPYRLCWDLEATELVPSELIGWRAEGDLAGAGTWRLRPTWRGTEVVSDARLRTTRRWMNLLEPLARPVFERNHHLVMEAGIGALAAHLGTEVTRYEHDEAITVER
jgi:hypothetical protein